MTTNGSLVDQMQTLPMEPSSLGDTPAVLSPVREQNVDPSPDTSSKTAGEENVKGTNPEGVVAKCSTSAGQPARAATTSAPSADQDHSSEPPPAKVAKVDSSQLQDKTSVDLLRMQAWKNHHKV